MSGPQYAVACPYCLAPPGKPCRTFATRRVTDTHRARVDAAHAAQEPQNRPDAPEPHRDPSAAPGAVRDPNRGGSAPPVPKPGTVSLDLFLGLLSVSEKLLVAHAHVNMDTAEDRELHARVVTRFEDSFKVIRSLAGVGPAGCTPYCDGPCSAECSKRATEGPE